MDIELKECPCCKGEAELETCTGNGKIYIKCKTCGMSTARPRNLTDDATLESAVRQWNNRPEPYGEKFPEIYLEYCPFCGNRHKIFIASEFDYYAFCDFCYAQSGEYPTKAEAIAAWNRRD